MDDTEQFKELLSRALSDLAGNFLYYDRKEDEDLPLGAIEKAVKEGRITPEFLVEEFEAHLYEGLGIKPDK